MAADDEDNEVDGDGATGDGATGDYGLDVVVRKILVQNISMLVFFFLVRFERYITATTAVTLPVFEFSIAISLALIFSDGFFAVQSNAFIRIHISR